ncbi:MAG: RluA family pseudouridine synthase [bacterium]|nr:RluA family pseudouridine synthase [bacterium]
MDVFSVSVPLEADGARADVFLAEKAGISRSRVKKLMDEGRITVNGLPASPSKKLKAGDLAEAELPEPESIEASPENIPIDIMYQDSSIAVINKPRGMSVHPGAGRSGGTLVNALLFHIKDLSGIGGSVRPGIVHRLDMNTSGIIVIAKNDASHERLSQMFERREIKKEYFAIAHGTPDSSLHEIDAPIGRHPNNRLKMAVAAHGRPSLTLWRAESIFRNASFIHVWPKTGRTHQIRVHLAYAGYPIMGDFLYGAPPNQWGASVQMLHAGRISFAHPETGKLMEFESPLPDDMAEILKKIN